MYMRIAFLLLVCSSLYGSTLADGRQLGGRDVNVKTYPFVAAIHWGSHFVGNGAILSPKWVISTFHTLQYYPSDVYKAYVGGNTAGGGTRHLSERIYLHDEATGFDYDIAMMKVGRKIKFTPTVQPVPLTTSNEASFGNAVMLSYGKNEQGNTHLRAAEYSLTSDTACTDKLQERPAKDEVINGRAYCANPSPASSLRGHWYDDAGAPIIVNKKLVAVWAYTADLTITTYNNASVATRIGSFRDWISSTMRN